MIVLNVICTLWYTKLCSRATLKRARHCINIEAYEATIAMCKITFASIHIFLLNFTFPFILITRNVIQNVGEIIVFFLQISSHYHFLQRKVVLIKQHLDRWSLIYIFGVLSQIFREQSIKFNTRFNRYCKRPRFVSTLIFYMLTSILNRQADRQTDRRQTDIFFFSTRYFPRWWIKENAIESVDFEVIEVILPQYDYQALCTLT